MKNRKENGMRVTISFDKTYYDKTKKIIIYGAGRYGELAYWGLKALGLRPDFFVDENRAGQEFLGCMVKRTEELRACLNDIVLVASYNYFFEMVSNLQSMGFDEIYDILGLIRLEYDEKVLSEYLSDEKNNWKKYANLVENTDLDKLIINHCELVVTECCTLKCRDCANLMQYYEHPVNLDIGDTIRYFNRFLDSVDMLLELRILGGEPFIVKDLDRIIDEYVGAGKIKRIVIYSNSTIIPSERVLKSLKKEKISIHMSDYGDVCKKVYELEKIYTENGIEHYIHKYDKWSDLGNIDHRDYTDKEMSDVFRNCMMAKCYTFYRGRLFVCPRSAHGERLGCFKNGEDEFVDFRGKSDINSKRLELKELINRRKYITACNYCNGSLVKSKIIPAAVQCEKKTINMQNMISV